MTYVPVRNFPCFIQNSTSGARISIIQEVMEENANNQQTSSRFEEIYTSSIPWKYGRPDNRIVWIDAESPCFKKRYSFSEGVIIFVPFAFPERWPQAFWSMRWLKKSHNNNACIILMHLIMAEITSDQHNCFCLGYRVQAYS